MSTFVLLLILLMNNTNYLSTDAILTEVKRKRKGFKFHLCIREDGKVVTYKSANAFRNHCHGGSKKEKSCNRHHEFITRENAQAVIVSLEAKGIIKEGKLTCYRKGRCDTGSKHKLKHVLKPESSPSMSLDNIQEIDRSECAFGPEVLEELKDLEDANTTQANTQANTPASVQSDNNGNGCDGIEIFPFPALQEVRSIIYLRPIKSNDSLAGWQNESRNVSTESFSN